MKKTLLTCIILSFLAIAFATNTSAYNIDVNDLDFVKADGTKIETLDLTGPTEFTYLGSEAAHTNKLMEDMGRWVQDKDIFNDNYVVGNTGSGTFEGTYFEDTSDLLIHSRAWANGIGHGSRAVNIYEISGSDLNSLITSGPGESDLFEDDYYYYVIGFEDSWSPCGNDYDDLVVAVKGDLIATPIPGAAWLLGSGLIGLVGIRKRFRKRS